MCASDLRTEIIETQKNRTELVKWKLLLIAGLGAVSLGLGEKAIEGVGAFPAQREPPIQLLALIPLVCFYVDVLSRHQQARILVIAFFLRESADELFWRDYERYARAAAEKGAFSLEDWALKYSTWFFSALVVIVAIFQRWENLTVDRKLPFDPCFWVTASGILGLGLSFLLNWWTPRLTDSVEKLANEKAWLVRPTATDPY